MGSGLRVTPALALIGRVKNDVRVGTLGFGVRVAITVSVTIIAITPFHHVNLPYIIAITPCHHVNLP